MQFYCLQQNNIHTVVYKLAVKNHSALFHWIPLCLFFNSMTDWQSAHVWQRARQRAVVRELVRRILHNAQLIRRYGSLGERKGQRYAEALQSLLRCR